MMIIAGFPCIGKTTIAKKYSNVVDLSSTPFHYVVSESEITEKLKGNTKMLSKNPLWPQNYIDAIKKTNATGKIVLILGRDYILEELNRLKIGYMVAVPEDGLKQEYLRRADNRGNTKEFVQLFGEKYNEWRNMMIGQPGEKIYLKSGEYIEDTLLRLGFELTPNLTN